MPRACAILLFSATFFGATCAAQTTPAPQTLTLAQAVAIAIQHHPRIAAVQNLELASGQRVVEARSAYYPIVTADITGSQANSLSRIGAGLLASSSLFNREGDGFTATQLV